jgi:hypothetical protein
VVLDVTEADTTAGGDCSEGRASWRVPDGLVEVVAEPIRCHDEEDAMLSTTVVIDAPVPDLGPPPFELGSEISNLRDEHGGALLGRITTVERESDPRAVSLEDDRRDRLLVSLNFHHAEVIAIPPRGDVQVRHG